MKNVITVTKTESYSANNQKKMKDLFFGTKTNPRLQKGVLN